MSIYYLFLTLVLIILICCANIVENVEPSGLRDASSQKNEDKSVQNDLLDKETIYYGEFIQTPRDMNGSFQDIQPSGVSLKNYTPHSYVPPQDKTSVDWPMGVVPYYIDKEAYDRITIRRIVKAMDVIETSACVLFSEVKEKKSIGKAWLHLTNDKKERECVHGTRQGQIQYEFILVFGYDCLRPEEILHSLLHGIGFRDEVTHPNRDQYIRVLWENVQPKYRPLFGIDHDNRQKVVEYDPASIMHFHDREFSSNGAATIAPLIPGLNISPSTTLSQLDVMKLQLLFGHGCKQRQVDELLDTCKNVLQNNTQKDLLTITNSQETPSNDQNDDNQLENKSDDKPDNEDVEEVEEKKSEEENDNKEKNGDDDKKPEKLFLADTESSDYEY